MRQSKLAYVVMALALLALVVVPRTGFGDEDAARFLDQGNKLALEAQRTQGKLPQAEKFKDAIERYQRAVKEDQKSVEGARALLAIAKIRAGVPIDARPGSELKPVYETKQQNLYQARDRFREVLQRFDGTRTFQDLVNEYGPNDARQIRGVVDEARSFEDLVGKKIDLQYRTDPVRRYAYGLMDLLVTVTGRSPQFSYWFALVLLAVIVKVLITPLTKAQFKSMREMQRLQPLVKELQEKYKGDQKELGGRVMDLYKEHGVNPLSGCLPILIQMPVLIGVYTMIRYYEYQFAKGAFLWIGWDTLAHKFAVPLMGRPVWVTAENLAQPDLILLILYTISMVVSQKLTVVDPTQAEQQKIMSIMMPVMFFFIIGYLPSAFVLYWFVFNVLQTWQQYHVIHGGAPPPETAGPAAQPVPQPPRPRPSGRRRRRR